MCHFFLVLHLAVAFLLLAAFLHSLQVIYIPNSHTNFNITINNNNNNNRLSSLPTHSLFLLSPYETYILREKKDLESNLGAMMVQTLIPCSPASKTEEILSRYRPIAPKPELPANSDGGAVEEIPHKIKHSPYLRNIWAHLQARPTRTRKRGRSSIAPALKRHQKIAQTPFLGLCCPSPLSFISHNLNPITLPLLSSSSSSSQSPVEVSFSRACQTAIDLNLVGHALEEKDLILQLKSPTSITTNNPWSAPHVIIAPKPIRPIGSTIRVGPISPTQIAKAELKKPEEVEAEMEAEELPAVISDSNNKVRMVNSAYKEMVGQPECRWLDSLTSSVAGRRISGEVMLQMAAGSDLPVSSNGFSCWARIEWGRNKEKESVDALCDVVRLCCESKDYLFNWRFHTKQANAS